MGELYDRDLLGGTRPPPDVDATAYGDAGSADRRYLERRHAREQLEEAAGRLERIRDRPDLYGQAAIDACAREVAGWRQLAGDLSRYAAAELVDDVPLF